MKFVKPVTQMVRYVPDRRFRMCAILCAAIAATASFARADWTHFRFDPAHRGVNPNETILSPANVANLTVKWRTNIGGGCFASASIFEGKLYTADTGSADGKLHALDIATGQVLWTFPSDALRGDHSWTTPPVANGIVYFGVNRPIPVVYRRQRHYRSGSLASHRPDREHCLFACSTRQSPLRRLHRWQHPGTGRHKRTGGLERQPSRWC